MRFLQKISKSAGFFPPKASATKKIYLKFTLFKIFRELFLICFVFIVKELILAFKTKKEGRKT